MPQRKKPVPLRKQPGSATELRQALMRRKKAELVDALMELAQANRGVLRQLTARFDVATAPDELIAATSQAIADATAFDERDINRNFDYDDQAYGEVKRNLGRLIGSGQLRPAMSLALELMKRGSYQVEMSDEGLMTVEIEGCLNGRCPFCAHGGVGRDFLKSALVLRVSGDGKAGEVPSRKARTRRLASFAPTARLAPPRRLSIA
jgi:hypothetical protein